MLLFLVLYLLIFLVLRVMISADEQKNLIKSLQQDILQWEGYKAPAIGRRILKGLSPLEDVFPNGIFPLGTVHEMLCHNTGEASAGSGWIAGLLSLVLQNKDVAVWISLSHPPFPPALKSFGLIPDRLFFIRVKNNQEALWVMEEALKCSGLSAVIAEIRELDFKQSRRLQLAVEQSHVTGFILRNAPKKIGTTACASRWQINPLPSETADALPGLGFPRWQVALLRTRNGKTGCWTVEWADHHFRLVNDNRRLHSSKKQVFPPTFHQKTG